MFISFSILFDFYIYALAKSCAGRRLLHDFKTSHQSPLYYRGEVLI